jgi:hypothetical protein
MLLVAARTPASELSAQTKVVVVVDPAFWFGCVVVMPIATRDPGGKHEYCR